MRARVLHSECWLICTLLLSTSFLPYALAQDLPRAGDYKEGYESPSYSTLSRSVEKRKGKEADLYSFFLNPPQGLPRIPVAKHNPQTRSGIKLGRRLFFDRRLSLNDTMSCAICHVPEMGFAHNELKTSVGIEGRSVRRNAPTMLNVAYRKLLFHDGRESSLENQVWSPLLKKNEMANPSIGAVIEKIRGIDDYEGMFEAAFGEAGVSIETIGKAIAQYLRTLVSANSRFDRWYYGKEKDALSEQEQLGFAVFTGKGNCSACHLINNEYALFFDDKLHNTGLGFDKSMKKTPKTHKVQLAPGVFVDVKREIIDRVTRAPSKVNDVGRYEVTQNPNDRWKYVTPTLRNIELTAPYMHDGSLQTLEEVIEFYDKGGIPNELLSPLIKPLQLSKAEKRALHQFLLTLTGSNYATLVYDAFAAPIGEIRANDPFWANQHFKKAKEAKETNK